MSNGRRVYGAAAILMGAVGLAFGHHAAPAPWREGLAYAGDAVLILGGIGINLGRRIAVCAALAIAAYFAVSLALIAPGVAREWKTWVTWQNVAEQAAMGLGALVAWAQISGSARAVRIGEIARRLFGLCLVVFGISHFVYLKFTASLVPAWMGPQSLWAAATGAGHIAAGVAILSGVLARLASELLVAMFAAFGLLVWLPALIHDPRSHDNWSEAAVTCVLIGAAWCVAEWVRERKRA